MGIGTLRRYHNRPSESVSAETSAPATDGSTGELPKRNASKSVWSAHALANGYTESDLEGMKRDDIAALFPEVGDTPDEPEGEESTPDADESE